MKTTEFKKAYEAVSKELAEHAAHGTIETLSCYYRTCLKTAENLTENQRKIIDDAYNNAYETIRTRLKKGGKEMPEEKKAVEEKPEVLKGEVIDTKEEKAVNAAIERVSKKIETIGKGYVSIVGDVNRLYDLKAWKYTSHKDFYQMCAEKFGMARGTVSNLRKIFERFGNRDNYTLTDECKDMSLRQMLATIKAEEEARIEDKGGNAGDGDGDGDGNGGKSSKKKETLVSIDFELVGDGWTPETILQQISEQLSAACAELTFGAGEKVQLTILR